MVESSLYRLAFLLMRGILVAIHVRNLEATYNVSSDFPFFNQRKSVASQYYMYIELFEVPTGLLVLCAIQWCMYLDTTFLAVLQSPDRVDGARGCSSGQCG